MQQSETLSFALAEPDSQRLHRLHQSQQPALLAVLQQTPEQEVREEQQRERDVAHRRRVGAEKQPAGRTH